jgi:hypothetical protein
MNLLKAGSADAFAGVLAVAFAAQAQAAPMNIGPPPGSILNLSGQPITNSQDFYSVSFVATVADIAITFAFRQDPSFVSFSNVSVVDTLAPGLNLISNGDFSSGTLGTSTVTDWEYANIYGATFGGVLQGGCGYGGGNCWYDGAVQAYDAISQTIATTIGDTYTISFNLNGGGSQDGYYRELSDNGNVTGTGGNGINVTVSVSWVAFDHQSPCYTNLT